MYTVECTAGFTACPGIASIGCVVNKEQVMCKLSYTIIILKEFDNLLYLVEFKY